MHFRLSRGRLRSHSADNFGIAKQVHGLVLHEQLEAGKLFGLFRQEIQEVPLRHEGNEFAVRGQAGEVCRLEREVSEDAADRGELLVGHTQKILQDTQLMHHLEGRRVYRVAAEVAEEILMLLQHGDAHARGPADNPA